MNIPASARPLVLLAAVVAAAAGSVLLPAAPARAHDQLVSSDPADGAVVDALPAEVAMRFSGDLVDQEGVTEVVVTDASGAQLASGDPVVDGRTVTQALERVETSGTVTVAWRVVSGDGHPVSGEFRFGVGAEPSTPAAEPDESSATEVGTAAWAYLGIGAVAVAAVAVALWSGLRPRRRG